VAVTAGSGTTIAADEVVDGTLGTVKVQYVKIMDATLDGTTKAAVGANGLASDVKAVPADPFGANADAAVTAGATGSISAKLRSISRDIGSLVVAIGSTAWDLGVGTGGTRTQRVSVDTAQLAALATTSQAMSAGYQLVGLPTDLTWPKGLSNKAFVAAFTTLTRPANTTAYTALDSISDNATAGSVTALSATVSDTNDDPIFVNEILVSSTDTGLAGKRIRAYLFNSDPTSSTGVGGGDNAAY